MYSQCPDCLARFRVTAAQLRAAHGTVGGGGWGSAFAALGRLSDSWPKTEPVDETGVLPDERDELAAATKSGVPPEYHFSAADLEKVFIEARDWSPPTATRPTFDSDSEPHELIVEEPEQVEDITLEGERIALDGGDLEDVEDDDAFPPAMADASDAETPLDFDLTGDVEILDEDAAERLDEPAEPEAANAEASGKSVSTTGAAKVTAPASPLVARSPPSSPASSMSAERPVARDWP